MIYYLPIEPYEERFTFQLKLWTEAAFIRNNVDFITIEPQIKNEIIMKNGSILDYWQRCKWCNLQINELLIMLQSDDNIENAVIYFQDMFHPSIESLPYIFSQLNVNPKIYVHNLAQSMDIYDFTFPMIGWMRHYELMLDNFVSGIFVANEIHKELMMASGFKSKIIVTGLPFDVNEVRSRTGIIEWKERKNRVVFTSRLDKEKQPLFFLEVAKQVKNDERFSSVEFAILQGGHFRSNDNEIYAALSTAKKSGEIVVYDNLKKNDYYRLLSESRCQFNCSLQDFVSSTLNEASAFFVPTVAPCFRGFPEVMVDVKENLYFPFSVEDAAQKIKNVLLQESISLKISSPALISNKTLDNVCKIINQKNKQAK